jgi:predicted DNA binding protein
MSIIAEFSIPPEALPGGRVLAEMPEMSLELERIVPTDQSALPFFWVWGDDAETFVEKGRDEPGIEEMRVLDRVEQGILVRAVWTPDAEIIQAIKTLGATVLEASGTAEKWTFRVRANDRGGVVTFQEVFTSHDITVTLDRIYNLSELLTGSQYELTAEQRETLVAAYHDGYYEKPRRITQKELGERFGITSRAISDRLRRGTANLVASTLVSSPATPKNS